MYNLTEDEIELLAFYRTLSKWDKEEVYQLCFRQMLEQHIKNFDLSSKSVHFKKDVPFFRT